jgi:hypothetical protein
MDSSAQAVRCREDATGDGINTEVYFSEVELEWTLYSALVHGCVATPQRNRNNLRQEEKCGKMV